MCRQIRIFIPLNARFRTHLWAEIALGSIIKPLIIENPDHITWFWFTRYYENEKDSKGNCDLRKIPPGFKNGNGYYRSIRFRYSVTDSERDVFEEKCRVLIDENQCAISDFEDYDPYLNFSSSSFVKEDRDPTRLQDRANTIMLLVHAVSRLTLETLIETDQKGVFRFENDKSKKMRTNQTMLYPLHLIANITGMELSSKIIHNDGKTEMWNLLYQELVK